MSPVREFTPVERAPRTYLASTPWSGLREGPGDSELPESPSLLLLLVPDEGVYQRRHDADDDGRDKRAPEGRDVQAHAEQAIGEP